jgi:uncharacterized membrane protein
MSNKIDQYLAELKHEMAGCDRATIQDATADAHEHLALALANLKEENPDITEAEALKTIITNYGSPAEIAAAYRQAEAYIRPFSAASVKSNGQGPISRFMSIYGDSSAWGSMLYMLITILTGSLYFTWATYSVALSITFALFIFGIPLAVLFLLSMRGLGVLEGRMVEGLLGVRMPRRPIFFPRNIKWSDRLMLYLKDKQTWLILLYLLLQMPLGVIYIAIWMVMVGLSIAFMVSPILQEILHLPIINLGPDAYYVPTWSLPLFVILGFGIFTAFLHAAKGIGKLHGTYAKRMLVAE